MIERNVKSVSMIWYGHGLTAKMQEEEEEIKQKDDSLMRQ